MSVVKSLGEWQEGKRQQAEKASSRPEPQLALDETVINDADCETALEERQRHREALSEYRKTFKEADEKASGEIAKLELPEGGAVRVGRFRITRQAVAARSVAFDVEATSRIRISVIDN